MREGITNVVRHSGARQVRIRIDRRGQWAEATITDDGPGARPAGAGRAEDGRGSGLTGLSERVKALGGRFEAGPVASGGFRLDVALPLEEVTS